MNQPFIAKVSVKGGSDCVLFTLNIKDVQFRILEKILIYVNL